MHEVGVNLEHLRKEIQDVETRIKGDFFEDLFRDILNLDNVRTATEIAQRNSDRLTLLGPVVERLQSGTLDVIIDRVYSIMDSQGLIPEPPEELRGQDIGVEYIGLLAQAQKAVSITGIEQIAGFVGNLAAAQPEVLDKLNTDEAVDTYADAIGVPTDVIRSDEEVEKIRSDRAQAQQAQQAAESAAQAAQGAKLLSETDTGGNNALTQLFGQ